MKALSFVPTSMFSDTIPETEWFRFPFWILTIWIGFFDPCRKRFFPYLKRFFRVVEKTGEAEKKSIEWKKIQKVPSKRHLKSQIT
ncbi:hypothetical protein LEP1GSC158_2629 [Leptospira interrogans serovar Zanoni str. LT2156]|uniref:Uncharacterized protein n=1 Tax=Leptospira interrogans serovar Zanoni str. LT2156 TaxID=1001601 RepID=M6I2N9_LEPIR|nr:hypothetical protein LEP1GSC158_2629 [Leptospira interrogans serovar Zanoni str. LT2156]